MLRRKRSETNWVGRVGLVGLCLLSLSSQSLSCQSPPPPPGDSAPPDGVAVATPEAGSALATDPAGFSGVRAWHHLVALENVGPRVSGRKGARRARAYLYAELESLGLEVRELRVQVEPAGAAEAVELVHLVAVLPGESPDVFLLAAHYDTRHYDSFRYLGTNESASGAALLLELGRVMSLSPQPYTIWLSFIDGDALSGGEDTLGEDTLGEDTLGEDPLAMGAEGSGTDEQVPGDPAGPATDATGELAFLGSRSFVSALAVGKELEGIRLAVVFDAVADSDLRIARDLSSHRVYRETFWEAAHDLDQGRAFSPDQGLELPQTAHRSFADQGIRGVVAIVDNRYGGDVVPGAYWHTEDDTGSHCSPRSLAAVGEVSVEALGRIGERLSRIDRFAAYPLEGLPGPPADAAP